MKHSIKRTFTLIFVAIVAALLLTMYIVNRFFLQSYYLNRKIGMLNVAYDTIDKVVAVAQKNDETVFDLINEEYGQNVEDSPTISIFRTLNERSNIDIVLTDSSGSTMASTSREGEWLGMKLRLYLDYRDFFSEDSDISLPKPSRNKNGSFSTDLGVSSTDSGSSDITIVQQNGNYIIQKFFDQRSNSVYLESWGTFSDGSTNFLMSMPVASIDEGVAISSRFNLISGIIILVIGSIAVYLASSQVTRPINKLAHLSERMSQLDFSARYEGSAQNEIGLLGASMNTMSDRLEETIGQLQETNAQLQDANEKLVDVNAQLQTANAKLQEDISQKEKIDEMRKDFIANVSHELKTPIALIEGYAEGLQEGIADDKESRDYYCSVIVDESAKMNKMVRQLTSLISYEFGAIGLDMETFDLSELIRSVVSSNRLKLEEADANLTMDLCEPAIVTADEFKLEEVFTNYMSNAVNHLGGKRRIKVTLSEEGTGDEACREQVTEFAEKSQPEEWTAESQPAAEKAGKKTWRLSVYNDGEPIPEESLPHVWEKFYKVDKARTRAYGGSGIGLSIVKAIMDAHGGEYGVENKEEGVEFWIRLKST